MIKKIDYKPKISIVMPVYNVEKYVEKGIRSVCEQTYKRIEIILVNDCSSDNSLVICRQMESVDNRIKVIDLKKNGGLSNARNCGLQYATGDYIMFLDSDDYIEKSLLESIVKILQTEKVKLIVYGLTEEYEDRVGKIINSVPISETKMISTNVERIRRTILGLEKKTLFGYAWNKVYDLHYLREQNILFKNITMIEDVQFNIEYVRKIESIAILDETAYHYAIRNNGSLTSKFLPNYYEIHVERIKLIIDLYKEWGMYDKEVKKTLADIYARYFMSALQRNYDKRAKLNFKKRISWIKEAFDSPIFNELIPEMKSQNKVLKIMGWMMKNKSWGGCLISSYFIYIIKNKLPNVFSKLKQNR